VVAPGTVKGGGGAADAIWVGYVCMCACVRYLDSRGREGHTVSSPYTWLFGFFFFCSRLPLVV